MSDKDGGKKKKQTPKGTMKKETCAERGEDLEESQISWVVGEQRGGGK